RVEPEEGKLREYLALARDGGRQHDGEGTDAVGGDDQQPPAEVVDVPHLSAPPERQTGDSRLEERRLRVDELCWLRRRHAKAPWSPLVFFGGGGVYRKGERRGKKK